MNEKANNFPSQLWEEYSNSLEALKTSMQNARTKHTDIKRQEAEQNSKTYTNSQIKVLNDNISLKVDSTTYNEGISNINKTIAETKAEIKLTTDSISQRVASTETTTSTLTGKVNITVKEVQVYYAINTSSTTAPTSGWSTTPPTWSDGKYIWSKTTTTLTNGTSTTTNPVCITGAKGATGATGATGASGKGVSSITNYYLATTSNSGVTTSTSGWTTTVQSVSSSKKYLWNYEKVTYTDNTSESTTPCVIGAYGDTGATGASGKGIKSIVEYYAVSSSNTTAPTNWLTTMQNTTTTNKYLWNYEVVTYTDNSTTSTPKKVIGTHGDTGATGTGIQSITTEYYLSTSKTTQTGGSWVTTQPTWSNGKYLWTRSKIVYKNPTSTAYTTPICDSSWEAVNEVKPQIDANTSEITTTKNQVAELITTADSITQRVASTETTTKTLTTQVNTAQKLAETKAKVFTSTPTAPYTVGDLWSQGSGGDLMRCKTTRTSGSYTASDWEKANKYTDDTTANTALSTANTANNTANTNKNNINTLTTTIKTTNDKVATIETNLSSITSRVSSTESSVSTINGNISSLQNRVNTAEQKITDSAIVSTVTSSQTYKDGLSGKVSTSQVISSINQTAEAIKISANKLDLTGELDLQGRFKCWKSNSDKTGNYLHMDGAMMFGYNKTGGSKPVFASGLWTDENRGYFSVGYTNALNSDENGCLWLSSQGNNNGGELTFSKKVGNDIKYTNIYFNKNGSIDFKTDMYGANDNDDTYTYRFDSGVSTRALRCNNIRTYNIYPRATSSYNIGSASMRYKDVFADSLSTTNSQLRLGTVTSTGAWQTYGALDINSKDGYVYPDKGTGQLSLGMSSMRFHTLYSVNTVSVSSDKRVKTDIHYLDEPVKETNIINSEVPRVERNMNITTQDMYNFIKDNLKLASYRYNVNLERGNTSTDYGFIAQDVLYTKVGSEIVQLADKKDLNSELSYNQGNYISVIAGALQEEIKLRDNQIEILEKENFDLKARLDKIEKKLNIIE